MREAHLLAEDCLDGDIIIQHAVGCCSDHTPCLPEDHLIQVGAEQLHGTAPGGRLRGPVFWRQCLACNTAKANVPEAAQQQVHCRVQH